MSANFKSMALDAEKAYKHCIKTYNEQLSSFKPKYDA